MLVSLKLGTHDSAFTVVASFEKTLSTPLPTGFSDILITTERLEITRLTTAADEGSQTT